MNTLLKKSQNTALLYDLSNSNEKKHNSGVTLPQTEEIRQGPCELLVSTYFFHFFIPIFFFLILITYVFSCFRPFLVPLAIPFG